MTNNIPFLSIATPCYNSAETIERTLKSILVQNYKNYEYIIIDGGSTDGTLDIIRRYEPLFEGRMTWISERDKGLYDAFNKGILRSNGYYCWNVNSDDFIEPDAFQTLYDFSKDFPKDDLPCIIGQMRFVSRDGTNTISITPCVTQQLLEKEYHIDGMGLNHPATIVPRAMYAYVGLYDIRFRISADIDWFNRAYAAGVKMIGINKILTNMADGGISNGAESLKTSAKDRLLSFRKKYCKKTTARIHLWIWWLRVFKKKITKPKR